jgi:hypothetical protein
VKGKDRQARKILMSKAKLTTRNFSESSPCLCQRVALSTSQQLCVVSTTTITCESHRLLPRIIFDLCLQGLCQHHCMILYLHRRCRLGRCRRHLDFYIPAIVDDGDHLLAPTTMCSSLCVGIGFVRQPAGQLIATDSGGVRNRGILL